MDKTDLTILVTITGWFVIYLIHLSGVKRAEAARRKDKLISDIESLIDWTSGDDFFRKHSPEIRETIYSIRITNIELRRDEFFKSSMCRSVDDRYILELRELDCSNLSENEGLLSFQGEVVNIAGDIIQEIESSYNSTYSKSGPLQTFLVGIYSKKEELAGAFFGLLIVFLFVLESYLLYG